MGRTAEPGDPALSLTEWLAQHSLASRPRAIRPLVPLVPRLPALEPEPKRVPKPRKANADDNGVRLCECGEPSLRPTGERTCERCAKLEASYLSAVWGNGRKPDHSRAQYKPNPPEYPQISSSSAYRHVERMVRRLNRLPRI